MSLKNKQSNQSSNDYLDNEDIGKQLILHSSANGQTKVSRTVALLSDDPYRPNRPKKRAKVLDEDDFVDSLQTIIERDYYPDLPRIRTKLAWLKVNFKFF